MAQKPGEKKAAKMAQVWHPRLGAVEPQRTFFGRELPHYFYRTTEIINDTFDQVY